MAWASGEPPLPPVAGLVSDDGTLMDRLSAALMARARRTAERPAEEYAVAFGALLGALCSHPETLRALVDSFEALAEAGTGTA